MKTQLKSIRPAADDYLNLVRSFPLRKFQTDAEHAQAVRVLSHLIGKPNGRLTPGENDYAEALGQFIKEYDDRVHPFPRIKSTPLAILRYLMDQSAMNVEQLGRVLGNKNAASLVLNGKRPLSKSHIFKLAERFKVEPGLFLEAPKKTSRKAS
jgi:HTH-type transcriptional regulator/antitoxin HigA